MGYLRKEESDLVNIFNTTVILNFKLLQAYDFQAYKRDYDYNDAALLKYKTKRGFDLSLSQNEQLLYSFHKEMTLDDIARIHLLNVKIA